MLQTTVLEGVLLNKSKTHSFEFTLCPACFSYCATLLLIYTVFVCLTFMLLEVPCFVNFRLFKHIVSCHCRPVCAAWQAYYQLYLKFIETDNYVWVLFSLMAAWRWIAI